MHSRRLGPHLASISKNAADPQKRRPKKLHLWLPLDFLINFHERATAMFPYVSVSLNALLVFYLSLSASVSAADQDVLVGGATQRRGYSKGELMPVSCLNRTM